MVLAAGAELGPGAHAETRDDRVIYSDNDEPEWVLPGPAPLADWVDERALLAPNPRFRQLARRVAEGRASKPMLREFYRLYPLLYPFERDVPSNWRLEAIASTELPPGKERGVSQLLGAPWTNIGPTNVGGRVSTIAIHPTNPNLAWVGAADGGVWRWTWDPAGSTWEWTPLFETAPTLSIGAIAVDPVEPLNLYIGTGEANFSLDEYDGVGVIRSTDGGNTWLAPVSVDGAGRIGQLAVSPADPRAVFAATSRGLYKTADSGDTWTRVLDAGFCDDVVIDPLIPLNVYAACEGNATNPWGVYKSTTGGNAGSFTQLSGSGACQLPSYSNARLALSMARSNPSVIYAAFENGNGEVWKTTDAGSTWCKMATPGSFCGGQCWYDMVLGVDPSNPDHILAGGVGFYRSTDGGQSWSAVTGMHVDQHAIRWAAGSARVALVGNDGGMYRLDMSGSAPAIRNVERNFVTAQYYGMGHDPVDATRVYGGTQDNGTHRFSEPATDISGVALLGCGDGASIRVHPALNNRLFHTVCPGGGNLEFLVSDDAGAASARQTTGIQVAEGSNWVPPIEVASASTIYTATASRVYRSTNADSSNPNQIQWTALDATQGSITTDLTPGGGSITTIASTAADPNTVWAGTSRAMVWVTTNGVDWTEVWLASGGRNRYIGEVIASQTDARTAWIVLGGYGSFGSGGHIFETTNRGQSWTDISGNLQNIPVNAILPHPTDPNRFWAGTWLGVYETRNHGVSWVYEPSIPRSAVVDLAYDTRTLTVWAATHGRGIWKTQDSTTSTPPLPVPDGSIDRGQPVWVAKDGSGGLRVSWEAVGCPGDSDYNLFWAPLTEKATFAYTSAACALGTSGVAVVTPPAGDLYFLMGGMTSDGVESGHRRVDGGATFEAANGIGICPAITARDVSQSCR